MNSINLNILVFPNICNFHVLYVFAFSVLFVVLIFVCNCYLCLFLLQNVLCISGLVIYIVIEI